MFHLPFNLVTAANLLATGTEGSRLLSVITAILCLVLRETPEKAWLVERIIFDPSVDIIALLNAGDSTLRYALKRSTQPTHSFGLVEEKETIPWQRNGH